MPIYAGQIYQTRNCTTRIFRPRTFGGPCCAARLHFATLSGVCLQGADLEGAQLPKTDLSTAQFDRRTKFARAELGTAKFWEEGGLTEEARGLSPDQILRAKEWEDAIFSPSFHAKLVSLAGTPTGGGASGAR